MTSGISLLPASDRIKFTREITMYRDEFKHYRSEEQYEVQLAGSRLNALLSSQALLFTGWAILHGTTTHSAPKYVLISIPAIALCICYFAYRSIDAAVEIIHRWQLHGARLIAEDRRDPQTEQLRDLHLNRSPNDDFHRWGVDRFSLAVPGAFMILWSVILGYSIFLK
jgi:hypothetical protein